LTVTKSTIIEKISEKIDLSIPEARDSVEILIEIIKSALASGEDVMISGFGKFLVNEKEPRKGRNPATSEVMIMKERRIVTFRLAGGLRKKLNKTEDKIR
jgi:integration host factor subunit alpha